MIEFLPSCFAHTLRRLDGVQDSDLAAMGAIDGHTQLGVCQRVSASCVHAAVSRGCQWIMGDLADNIAHDMKVGDD